MSDASPKKSIQPIRVHTKTTDACAEPRNIRKPCMNEMGFQSQFQYSMLEDSNLASSWKKTLEIEAGVPWLGAQPSAFDTSLASMETDSEGNPMLVAAAAYNSTFEYPTADSECGCEYADWTTSMWASEDTFGHGQFEMTIHELVPDFLNAFWFQGDDAEFNVAQFEGGNIYARAYCFTADGSTEVMTHQYTHTHVAGTTYGVSIYGDKIKLFVNGMEVHSVDTPSCFQDAALSMNAIISVEAPEEGQFPETPQSDQIMGRMTASNFRSFAIKYISIEDGTVANNFGYSCLEDKVNHAAMAGEDPNDDADFFKNYNVGQTGDCEGPSVLSDFYRPVGGYSPIEGTKFLLIANYTGLNDSYYSYEFGNQFKITRQVYLETTIAGCAQACKQTAGCQTMYVSQVTLDQTTNIRVRGDRVECKLFAKFAGSKKSTARGGMVFIRKEKAYQQVAMVNGSCIDPPSGFQNVRCSTTRANNNWKFACPLVKPVVIKGITYYPQLPGVLNNGSMLSVPVDDREARIKPIDGGKFKLKAPANLVSEIEKTLKYSLIHRSIKMTFEECAELTKTLDQDLREYFLNKFNGLVVGGITVDSSTLIEHGCLSFAYDHQKSFCSPVSQLGGLRPYIPKMNSVFMSVDNNE
jgi:hypothetical protein